MPECTHTTVVHAPLAPTWAFVREMDNWAPLLTGYQGHDKHDERTSTWRLKGDVGMLSREVALKVEITEWVEGERVEFTLDGVNEQVTGGGTFRIGEATGGGDSAESTETRQNPEETASQQDETASLNPWQRFVRWLFRTLFNKAHGETVAIEAPAAASDVELTFVLRMDAGGPMAPMINAMLEPALLPATEDLATRIANRVLELHNDGPQTDARPAT